MHKSLTLNGIRKEWLYLLRGRQESPYAPINHTLIHVSGMAGAHVSSTETDVLYVSQPVGFKVESEEHEQALLDELKEWLITSNDAEIQFDNVPGKTYIGRLTSNMSDYAKQGNLRSGTLIFLCKPYKYGKEVTKTLNTETGTIINVEGTAETKPVFELDVTAPITYAMVMNHLNEYMMIGQPIDVESQVPYQKYERVLSDDASSLLPWTVASSGDIDGGIVTGEIVPRNGRFVADTYGTGTNWHGPARKRGLATPLQDFRMVANLGFWNSTLSQVGRVEIYLKDLLGNDVCKIALKDTSNGQAITIAEFRAGGLANGEMIINEQNSVWNNFSGEVQIEREGNKWKAYIAQVDPVTGKHSSRRSILDWEDKQNKYMNSVAQIVFHIGAVGTHTVLGANSGLASIFMDKINQEPDGVPYIADAGDKIIFNFQTHELLLNGQNRKDLKTDLGSGYFTLKPGENTIALSPNAITGISKHRPAYK